MMMFWLILALFTTLILIITLWPLLRTKQDPSNFNLTDYDTAVYRSQLEEVDRDEVRGEISKEDAEAARLEISRRLLAVDEKQANERSVSRSMISRRNGFIATIIFGSLVSIASVSFYMKLGQPGMPNMAFAERAAEREAAMASRQMPEMDTVIAALKGQLEKTPDHQESWLELARMQMQVGQMVDATVSFAEAVRIDRNVYGVLASYGEAMVLASKGSVTDEMLQVFLEAGQKFPEDPRPKFYIAQHEFQNGSPRRALTMLVAMLREAPVDAEWVPAVRSETMALAQDAGIDISQELSSIASNMENRGPTAEDVADAANMSSDDRNSMIEGMVDQLAGRLEDEPDDVAGWEKLARAASVLGREEQIIEAYDNLIRLKGEVADLYLDKADALMQATKGRPTAEILSTMAKVLSLDPNNPDALWFSAMAALSIGDKVKAGNLFDKALNVIGKDSSDYDALRLQADQMLEQ